MSTKQTPQGKSRYAAAGVDVSKGEEAVSRMKKHVQSTFDDRVLRGIGSFAGAFSAKELQSLQDPVLLSTIDGVGTKTIIAERTGKWDGIGKDIVNHCANDLVCQGATPLFFLDYLASSVLDPSIIERIVASMSSACRDLQCALIGGETAEMPKVYRDGSYDVVGIMVGYTDKSAMITGDAIAPGDILIAFPSNGLHTNGYSLARTVLLDEANLDLAEYVPALGCSLGDALLQPHTCYSPLVRSLHKSIGLKGVAHITGGGIAGNFSRILPSGVGAEIERNDIRIHPLFAFIQKQGDIPVQDMDEAFNMGVGMIVVVSEENADAVLSQAPGSYPIGRATKGKGVILK